MTNRPDTIDVISSVLWVSRDEGRRACASAIDGYLVRVGGSASDRYDALQRLRIEIEGAIGGRGEAKWVIEAIDVRLSEVTASMSGVGRPSLSSDLVKP